MLNYDMEVGEQVIETKRGKYTVRIEQDTLGNSPRDWNNLGFMACFQNRYALGDKHDNSDIFDFLTDMLEITDRYEYVNLEKMSLDVLFEEFARWYEYLPLYLYDHSVITMNTADFSCPWNSGIVGYIYVSHKTIKKEYGELTDETIAKARKLLQAEVKTYNQYLTGDVYSYDVETEDGETLDSCSGIYGIDETFQYITDAINNHERYLLEDYLDSLHYQVSELNDNIRQVEKDIQQLNN